MKHQMRTFAEIEAEIERKLALYSWRQLARDLRELRDLWDRERFWLKTHSTFKEYCKKEFDMTPRRVESMIKSLEIAEEVAPNATNDSAELYRPMHDVPKANWKAIYDEAVKLAQRDG